MSHESTEALRNHDDPKAGPTAVALAIGTLGVLISVIAVTALYYGARVETINEKVLSGAYQDVLRARAAQTERLYAPPHWVDQPAGRVGVPLDLAIKRELAEQLKPHPVPATMPTQPASAPAAVPAPQTAPASGGQDHRP